MIIKECKSDNECYFVTKGPWYVWGRWVFLGTLIGAVLLLVPLAGYLMSLKRVRNGLQPIVGCGWMFKTPYKHTTSQDLEQNIVAAQPPRYRPHHMLDLYKRENGVGSDNTIPQASGPAVPVTRSNREMTDLERPDLTDRTDESSLENPFVSNEK